MSNTEEGAWRAADALREYWLRKGYIVKVGVIKLSAARAGFKDSKSVWGVRSDMVNGLPIRKVKQSESAP